MSCGSPHEVPCTEVRALLYVYIDGEIDQAHHIEVTTHLGECPPCESLFALEIAVKQRVRSALTPDTAPQELRSRVSSSIRSIAIAYRRD